LATGRREAKIRLVKVSRRGRSSLVGAMWLGAAACSSAPPPGGGVFTEGTRLRAVYQQADGAPPLLMHWHDTELGVDCRFRDVGLPDGRLVCFPDAVWSYDGTDITAGGCGESFVAVSSCVPPPPYFARWPDPGADCGTIVRLFSLGPAFTATPSDGACQPSGTELISDYHQIGPELPLDKLVSGSYQPGPGHGRIVPLTIVASDGSVEVAGELDGAQQAWDNERQEAVSTQINNATQDHWFPVAQYATYFSDSACTVPVLLGPACEAPSKDSFVPGTTDASGQWVPPSAIEVGARGPDGANLYDNAQVATGTCAPYLGQGGSPVPDPTFATYAVGASVPETAFAEAVEVRTGSRQLQLVGMGTADGPPAYASGFNDTVWGHPCVADQNVQAADGVVRCLPSALDLAARNGSDAAFFFADAACSVRLLLGPSDLSGQGLASRTAAISNPNGSCPGPFFAREHLYAVGNRYAGMVYGESQTVACSSLGSTDAPDQQAFERLELGFVTASPFAFYSVGPEIPASDFAPVTFVRPK
jgi:hypothetical protein